MLSVGISCSGCPHLSSGSEVSYLELDPEICRIDQIKQLAEKDWVSTLKPPVFFICVGGGSWGAWVTLAASPETQLEVLGGACDVQDRTRDLVHTGH